MTLLANRRSAILLFSLPNCLESHRTRIVIKEKEISAEIHEVDMNAIPEEVKILSPYDENNQLILKVDGQLSQKEYEQEITDLVNFLTYVSEPAQLERYTIGFWVMIFLVFFAFITYLLKIEYWRDIK